MQEASFLILTALAAGSQHGYGIITDVASISDGCVPGLCIRRWSGCVRRS
jgi:hypothetical protein